MARVRTASPVDTPTWSLPFSHDDWEQTPPAVRAHVAGLQSHVDQLQQQIDTLQRQIDTLQRQIDTLPDRLHQPSQTSHKPPSSDSPCTKSPGRTASGKRGARPGHKGSG